MDSCCYNVVSQLTISLYKVSIYSSLETPLCCFRICRNNLFIDNYVNKRALMYIPLYTR